MIVVVISRHERNHISFSLPLEFLDHLLAQRRRTQRNSHRLVHARRLVVVIWISPAVFEIGTAGAVRRRCKAGSRRRTGHPSDAGALLG